jgi:light-independent protochlorophyllide reductase subunit B
MFREDFEFSADAAASHLGATAAPPPPAQPATTLVSDIVWASDAEKELRKIPFFVRGKAKRNTERFAEAQGLPLITVETLYDAKAHYAN